MASKSFADTPNWRPMLYHLARAGWRPCNTTDKSASPRLIAVKKNSKETLINDTCLHSPDHNIITQLMLHTAYRPIYIIG